MKTMCISLMGLLMIACLAFGQTNDSKSLDTILKNYLNALKSDNAGLRNSALYQIVKIKAQYPEADLGVCEKCIAQMSSKDKNTHVRINAGLALLCLKDRQLPTKVQATTEEEPTKFFARLHQEI